MKAYEQVLSEILNVFSHWFYDIAGTKNSCDDVKQ